VDYAKAVSWFRKAAERGDARGLSSLGYMHRNGWGVPKDDAKAIFWFRKAAEQGNVKAQYNLGQMYLFGRGVSKDNIKAAHWLRKSVEQGHVLAQRLTRIRVQASIPTLPVTSGCRLPS
jgi:TPR repeat protein